MASGYCYGQRRMEYFHHRMKFYGIALEISGLYAYSPLLEHSSILSHTSSPITIITLIMSVIACVF